MSVAAHLGIRLAEYDRRIRTFIPGYEEMLGVTASTLARRQRRRASILDLGIGTGTLALRCLEAVPRGRLHAIDADPQMLAVAARRLRRRGLVPESLVAGSFLTVPLPRCDAITAALALHHVGTRQEKARLYRRGFEALAPGGFLVTADCFPPDDPGLARIARHDWHQHLRRHYSESETRRYFRTWAKEDTYFSLGQETEMLQGAGFRAEVVWRRGTFGVLVATRPPSETSEGPGP